MEKRDQQSGSTTGIVEWFDAGRDVGAIRPDDGSPVCSVESGTLNACGISSLTAGDRVQFRVSDESGGRTARDLAMMRAIQRWEGEGGSVPADGSE